MVVAGEEKRVAVLFGNLRQRPSVPDRSLGTPLRRGLIARRVTVLGQSSSVTPIFTLTCQ